jgi:hypothetical protein
MNRAKNKNPPDETKYKKGKSGNPRGRPKGSISLTSKLREALSAGNGKLADQLIKVWIAEALDGKWQYLQEIINRIDGPVETRLRIESELKSMLDIAESTLDQKQYEQLLRAIAGKHSQ